MTLGRRTALTLIGATILFAAEAAVFWAQDWRYNLPTLRPAVLVQAAPGTILALPREVNDLRIAAPGKPVLLHFYNPDCPCSKFNLDHVRALARRHDGQALVIAVLQLEPGDSRSVEHETQHLGFPAIADLEGKLAAACGVYSTPQAVVIAGDGRLLFRGNYNVSRYCASPATEFARLALEAAVNAQTAPEIPAAATVAYGCPLPMAAKD
jgi:hypothetical protein